MVTRRWTADQRFDLDGLTFRVCQGSKHPDDLRLDVWTEQAWRPVNMRLGAMLADFFHENEDILYPPPQYKGGKKYLDYLRDATRFGWAKADAVLRVERHQRDQQKALW